MLLYLCDDCFAAFQWESGAECVAWRRFADDASAAFVSAATINAVARSAASDLLATADELGSVRVFRNPCPEAGAASVRYAGHGSHVTACAFTPNDEFLLTAGGNDRWCVAAAKHAVLFSRKC